jgi:nucleoside-diphosphate-sugar epimerase
MRLLLTGASSFTGLWFARALAAAGHTVIAPTRALTYDDPLRQARIDQVGQVAELVTGAPFGGEAFLDLIDRRGPFDALCHHAAEAAGHKRPDFDVDGAVAANSLQAGAVLARLKDQGAARMVLTGSVFEADEGRGDEPRVAFSPYGRAKTLTRQAFEREARVAGLDLVKFVIPNPFGPHEAMTFQRHVMTAWREGAAPHVSHPFYERDNVPVDLLALAYVAAVEGRAGFHVSPSFYAGPVGAFFRRMAREVGARTGWDCGLTFADSQTFDEPRARMNTQPLEPAAYGWSEAQFWDGYARYYAELDPPSAGGRS